MWKRGHRTAALYRVDLTHPAARVTPAKRAAVAAMERARRTCRRQHAYRMPLSTWRCWECMAETGDYGQPAVA